MLIYVLRFISLAQFRTVWFRWKAANSYPWIVISALCLNTILVARP